METDKLVLSDSSISLEIENSSQSIEDQFTKYKGRKTLILVICFLTSLTNPMAGTMVTPVIPEMIKDLDTDEFELALGVSIYFIVLAVLPIFWGILSDNFGRKKFIVFASVTFVVTNFILGWTPDVWYFVVLRTIQAVPGSSFMTIGSGIVADVFPPAERGNALGWYTLGPAIGPLIGPICGGLIAEFLQWRWIFYIASMWGVILTISIIVFLPETSRKKEDKNFQFCTPFAFLVNPKILLLALANAAPFCVVLISMYTFPIYLERRWNYSSLEISLFFIPYGLCSLIGSKLGGILCDYYDKAYGKGGRLLTSLTGVTISCVVCILYAFATQLFVLLISIGATGFFFNFSRPAIYSTAMSFYPQFTSSVAAVIVMLQLGFGATALLVVPYLLVQDEIYVFWSLIIISIFIFVAALIVLGFVAKFWGVFRVKN